MTKIQNDDRDAIRRQIGLLTVPEVAAVFGCKTIDVHRQVAMGQFAFHRDGNGQTLLSQSDVHGFAADGCPGLDKTPELDGDGWITGPSVQHGRFVAAIKDDRAAYHHGADRGFTMGVAYLMNQARQQARAFASRIPTSPFNSMSLAERFYAAGPDRFTAAMTDVRKHLETKSLNIGGQSIALKSIAPRSFKNDIETAIREAF